MEYSSTTRKRNYLTQMLGLNKASGQLAMASSVHWYGHVLRMSEGHIFGHWNY